MLRKGGTKVNIVTSAVRDGIVSKQADEFLYAAGSEKVEEFWSSMFFCLENICWISYMAWNSAGNTMRILH